VPYPTDKTTTVTAAATDGTPVTLTVPAGPLPSVADAERLRALYREHVNHPTGHWKGPAWAIVPEAVADDVAEAMDFHGSLVDHRESSGAGAVYGTRITDGGTYVMGAGKVLLESHGYWAHGF